MTDGRPNPEGLLQAIQKMEAKEARGKLRVFLGMCPGVGKTYAMLKAAKEQQGRGVKVLVGIVETHGRKETEELVQGLPTLTRTTHKYKGSDLEELDLDSVLKQPPQLILIDELAHTNAPGSRHKRRYQDVLEILHAGIDVYTTLNIQHIESRNDQIAQITGIAVRETVPDSFLDEADQIEMIDLSPSELLNRLKEGKVYLGERAELAAQNFFKPEKLTALRELALRFTAERVDQDLHSQMTLQGIEGPWNTNERLLVAISHSPYSSRLIRTTRRMAYNLEAPWIALYVNTGERLDERDQKTLQKNLNLAKELGAEVVTITDTDLNQAIQRICVEKNVTQIVMGRPDKRLFRDFISRGTLLDQLVRTTSRIDVHVIRAERAPKYRGFHFRFPAPTTYWTEYYTTAWFMAVVTVAAYAALPLVGYKAIGPVFLVAILVVAAFSARGPILFSAIISAFAWDFLFIPPQFTFAIHSHDDIMMLISYFVTAVFGGYLTSKIRRQQEFLRDREERTALLYELGKQLAKATAVPQIIDFLAATIKRQFGGDAVVSVTETNGKLIAGKNDYHELSTNEVAVAQWVLEHGKNAGWSTDTLSASHCICLPMNGQKERVGVVAFYPEKTQEQFTIEESNFLENVVTQGAIAVERLKFAESAAQTKIYEASEKLHQTLLSSVSHELRTPLTSLLGTATALSEKTAIESAIARDALTQELVRSAKRLNRVVDNLLDVSRLEKGSLQLRKEWFQVDELVHEVKTQLSDELRGRTILSTGDQHALIEGDYALLNHAVANLVLNAVKYSEAKEPIEIEASDNHGTVVISVNDKGRGIPSGSEQRLFEKFFRLPDSPSGGLGLGLSIVKGIVEQHGGRVEARNRSDGSGSVFEITLPVRQAPQELKEILR